MTERLPNTIDELPTPALVVDLGILESNLSSMAQRAETLGVALRPHVKTHKCVEIGKRQLAHGARGITVSTLYEAQVFADHGFDDIVWAFPIVHGRIDEAKALARRIRLGVTVDTLDAVRILAHTGFPFEVHLKVDCGYHRAGVDPASAYAVDVARAVADATSLRLMGILSHSGHAYGRTDRASVARVAEEERRVMVDFATRLREGGLDIQTISVGSTPAMTAVKTLEGVTEARPGNYAFFDYSQVVFGSCEPKDCAISVVSSVVSSQPGGDHSIIDAGALALSKDPGPESADIPSMGRIYADYEAAALEPDLRLVSLSQEHGRLNRALAPGRRVRILPNHACLTVAQFDRIFVSRNDEITDAWRIWRGRR